MKTINKKYNKRLKKLLQNSAVKWILAIVTAFLLWHLIIIPLLSLITGSTTPITGVMTNSMEHYVEFDEWWVKHKGPYLEKRITKENFTNFSYVNGLNVGDMIFVVNKKPEDIKVGDILIFNNKADELIIHRVIDKWQENRSYWTENKYLFQTKGDNHYMSIKQYYLDENKIPQDRVRGVAVLRIPYIGYPGVLIHRLIDKIKK